MRGSVAVDANLLLLLIVGSADPKLISSHKRLRDDYTLIDFELVGLTLATFSEIILISPVLTETYNFAKQIDGPALRLIQRAFKIAVEASLEIAVAAVTSVRRAEFAYLGLTDAALLHVCAAAAGGRALTLMTADQPLAKRARVLKIDTLLYMKDIGFE